MSEHSRRKTLSSVQDHPPVLSLKTIREKSALLRQAVVCLALAVLIWAAFVSLIHLAFHQTSPHKADCRFCIYSLHFHAEQPQQELLCIHLPVTGICLAMLLGLESSFLVVPQCPRAPPHA